MSSKKPCDCAICKNQNDFEMPEGLLEEILRGNVVIFAGAGVSTESKLVMNVSFYETIACEMSTLGKGLPFPELMEAFCNKPNGRIKLIQLITARLNTIDSFPELRRTASRFHKEIGSLFFIKDIVTTNWDMYFERYCKATPFVHDTDLAFWEAANRRVLKIHGSVSSFGSLVATTSDYEDCQRQLESGLIGSMLKTLLATKTFLFAGYSLSDSDFLAIHGFVKDQMKAMSRQCYVVTPFSDEAKKLEGMGLTAIVTDATYFIAQVKSHAISQGVMLPDSIYEDAEKMMYLLSICHKELQDKVKMSEYPQVVYSMAYQDGLMHAFERAINMRYSGEYSDCCKMSNVTATYRMIREDTIKDKNYTDIAYVEGYLNGLMYLLMEDKEAIGQCIPLYFNVSKMEGYHHLERYIEELQMEQEKTQSTIHAERYVKEHIKYPNEVVFHHPPWL